MITILLVVGILVLLIVVHELGHFIVAKLFRVRVEEFGIGYPPRAFSFGRWGGTEYTLNWLPFGGFVRLFGDEGQGVKGRGSFVDAPRYVQILILLAGVGGNALAAWLLFAGALHLGIPRPATLTDSPQSVQLFISSVVPGSPADAVGLALADTITSIENRKGDKPSSLTPVGVADFVKQNGGEPLTVSYVRGGSGKITTLSPAHGVLPGAADQPALGVVLELVSTQSLPWLEAFGEAWNYTRIAFVGSLHGLGSVVKNITQGASALQSVVGPIGLVSFVGEAAQNGFGQVMALAALISVNLTIINLVPIPALDGGRLFIVIGETIARRAAPRLAMEILNVFGIVLITLLMVTVTYNDIARLLA